MMPGMQQGMMDPSMMQGMMAAMQQGQGGMQAMPGMPAMPGMQAIPPTAAAAQVAPDQLLPSPAQTELMVKTEAIQKCVENLSTIEKEYYTVLWDTSRQGTQNLEGKAAYDFFLKALPR